MSSMTAMGLSDLAMLDWHYFMAFIITFIDIFYLVVYYIPFGYGHMDEHSISLDYNVNVRSYSIQVDV